MTIELIGMIGTRSASELDGPQASLVGGHIDAEFLRRFAVAHEDAGFDKVLIGYGSSGPDGFSVAGYVASVTSRLGFLIGVVIRHYFNTRHARKGNPHWTWAVAIVLFIVIAWLSSGPKLPNADTEILPSASAERFMQTEHFAAASQIVQSRCAMCHKPEPVWEGIYEAPKNVILDRDVAIANRAEQVAIQAGYSHAMPPGNVTDMTDEERALIVAWFREGSQ